METSASFEARSAPLLYPTAKTLSSLITARKSAVRALAGFVVSSAERLILSEGPAPVAGPESKPLDKLGTSALAQTGGAVSMSNGPEGALFTLRE